MRSCVWLLPLLFCGIFLPLEAQEKNKNDKDKNEKKKAVQITWHGQSFFTITSAKGTVLVTDPHLIGVYGLKPNIKGDIVTMSHNHIDHNQLRALDNYMDKDRKIDPNLRIIQGLKPVGNKGLDWNIIDEQVKDFRIRSVGVYHDNMGGLTYGKNTVFIFEVDGWRIVHLGDLGHLLSPLQIREIGPVDVLMIPCGGIYSLNGDEAKQVVEQLQPKEYIFPMHCGTQIYKDLLPVDEFLDGVDRNRIVPPMADNKILLDRNPQRPRPLIVQLNYWPKR